MQTFTATHGKNETRKSVALKIAAVMGTEIVDSAKSGKAVEFFTADFRVIRVY